MFRLLFLFLFTFSTEVWALCVSASKANLRSGPGSKHPITWVAPQFTPLVRLDNTDYWYKVADQDGQIHWVFVSAVTSRFRCASIRAPYVNLRTGPGVSFLRAKYRAADKYEAFQLLEKKEEWVKLKSPWGETFWASRNSIWLPIRKLKLSY